MTQTTELVRPPQAAPPGVDAAVAAESSARTVWRWRVLAACLGLVALVFRQAPGLVVPDTKLDLTADPGRLLGRALTLWDDDGLGQLQNQAYGYLFPMGPFHWVLHVAGAPPWVVQRLWWALVLCTALLGVWRLTGALGLGAPAARLTGALLFALSPRMLSEIGITSIEVWPMAVAPWVLVPLVDRVRRPWLSRVLLSAAAFGCIGGVNAVATGAALVLPTLWFLTRRHASRALRRWLVWLAACLVAGAWWIGPLLLLGRYSPPFLDWIEDASVTTGMASAFDAFQGTAAWLGFLAGPAGPSWPAAWLFVTTPVLVLVTVLVASVGLTGLASPQLREGTWLRLSAVTGLALLTMGFAGALASPLAGGVRELLDGVLAAARNTHKFEVVLRLPLVLGLVHALSRPLPADASWRVARALRPLLVGLVVVAVAAPGVVGRLPRPEGYPALPDHWTAAARWLDAQPARGSVLVVPAASFADFAWGSTKDEPLQALSRRPFVVRDAVPLAGAGTTRLLDELVRRLGDGRGGPEVRRTLADMGIRYVVVRNDLRLDAQAMEPIALHEALDESGLQRRVYFGLTSHDVVETPTSTVDERTVLPYPSVEIFDVGDRTPVGPRLVPRDAVVRAVAAPEEVPAIGSALGPARVSVMGSDGLAAPELVRGLPTVLTDGARRQEVFFGRASDNTSPTLAADDPGRQGRRTLDYVSDPAAPSTTLVWDGIEGVAASSSASDADATLRLGPGTSPAAALDGDPSTRWVSGRFERATGEWLEVGLGRPRSVVGTTITVSSRSPVAAAPALVRVDTDRGSTTVLLQDTDAPQPLITPAGTTQRLRVTLVSTRGTNAGNGFSVAELTVPGLGAQARLQLPEVAGAAPDAVVLRSQQPGRTGCLHVGERPLCADRFVSSSAEGAGIFRTWTTTSAGRYRVSGTVLAAPGAAADAVVDLPGRATATASSRRVPGLEGRPSAVVDRDLGTGWVASADDPQPVLSVRLPAPRRVSGLDLVLDAHLSASRPSLVEVRLDGRPPVRTRVAPDGRVALIPHRASTVSVRFLASTPLRSVEGASGFVTTQPVGVSELVVRGAEDLVAAVDPARTVRVPCGFGPSVTVDGQRLTTQVVGTVRQALRGQPLRWSVCGEVRDVGLGSGRHVLDAPRSAEFVPVTLTLTRRGAPTPAPTPAWGVGVDGSELSLPARPTAAVLVVDHTFNAGWQASTSTGQALTPVRVDGWQQAYVVPAGPAVTVSEAFTPGTAYRIALGVGLLALLALLVTALRWHGRGRGRAAAPVGTGGSPAPLVVRVLPSVLVVLASGGWGLGALVLGEVAVRLLRRHVVWLVLGLGLLAGVLVALRPWLAGSAAVDSPVVQATVLVAFAVLARVGSRRRPQRDTGRSTP